MILSYHVRCILALVLVLVKCCDIKMDLLPFYLFITSLIKPDASNQQKNTNGSIVCWYFVSHFILAGSEPFLTQLMCNPIFKGKKQFSKKQKILLNSWRNSRLCNFDISLYLTFWKKQQTLIIE